MIMRTPEQISYVEQIIPKRPYRCKEKSNNIAQSWLSVLERRKFLFVCKETVQDLKEVFIKDFVRDNFLTIRSVEQGVIISKN